jgi:hypothetical protein
MFAEICPDYPSEWSAIKAVATKLGARPRSSVVTASWVATRN